MRLLFIAILHQVKSCGFLSF